MTRERSIFVLLVCFLVGASGWLTVRRDRVETARGSAIARQTSNDDEYAGVASPSLSPEQVVDIQIQSMRAAVESPEQIRDCFALASPGNREVTGPIDRFASMVMTGQYSSLARAPDFQIGSAVLEGDYAAVLVTTMSEPGVPNAFRFVLEKQHLSPYQDCWMTVAVENIEVASGSDDLPDSLPR